jgi:hypothetical protein
MNPVWFWVPRAGVALLEASWHNQATEQSRKCRVDQNQDGNASVERVDKESQHLIDKSW